MVVVRKYLLTYSYIFLIYFKICIAKNVIMKRVSAEMKIKFESITYFK